MQRYTIKSHSLLARSDIEISSRCNKKLDILIDLIYLD